MFLETLCNIPAKPQEWVWKGVIPAGQLTLVMGEPGVGKSMFAMDAIARVTRGQRGLSDTETGEPGEVILFSGEDDFASVVRLRLDSASADHRFVNVVERDTNPMFETPAQKKGTGTDDGASLLFLEIDSLESYLAGFRETGAPCRLIVIDPVNCFLDATESRTDHQSREMMASLADLAVRSGTAVLLVANPSTFEKGKRGRLSATTPVLAEAVRSVWTIVCDPDEPRRRMLLPVKTNLCETPPGLAFSIQDRRICWEEESVAQTAGQFLAEATQHQRLQRVAADGELSRATEWLQRRLCGGKVYSNDLKADAAENDFSEKSLRRALTLLGCRKGKEKKAAGQWYWRLPTSLALELANTRLPDANKILEPVDERDQFSKLTQNWPTSTSQKPHQTGNLANACEVGQLFCESMAGGGIEPPTPGFSENLFAPKKVAYLIAQATFSLCRFQFASDCEQSPASASDSGIYEFPPNL